MAIEPFQIGSFIPNKAGLPESLAAEPKPAVQKVAEAGIDERDASAQDPETSGGDTGRGERLNLKA